MLILLLPFFFRDVTQLAFNFFHVPSAFFYYYDCYYHLHFPYLSTSMFSKLCVHALERFETRTHAVNLKNTLTQRQGERVSEMKKKKCLNPINEQLWLSRSWSWSSCAMHAFFIVFVYLSIPLHDMDRLVCESNKLIKRKAYIYRQLKSLVIRLDLWNANDICLNVHGAFRLGSTHTLEREIIYVFKTYLWCATIQRRWNCTWNMQLNMDWVFYLEILKCEKRLMFLVLSLLLIFPIQSVSRKMELCAYTFV